MVGVRGTEGITPSPGEVAVVRQNDLPLIGPEVWTKAQASPAKSAEIGFDHVFFQILRSFDFHIHIFPHSAFFSKEIFTAEHAESAEKNDQE